MVTPTYEDLVDALDAAVEHMIWMTGGWGLDHKITDPALPLMRDGIDKAIMVLDLARKGK